MNVRVAAVQDCPVLLDREATLELVDQLTADAAGQGAQLVVFPEAFVPGPPVWVDALPVSADAEWHALLLRNCVTVPGAACDRLADLARSGRPRASPSHRDFPRSGSWTVLFRRPVASAIPLSAADRQHLGDRRCPRPSTRCSRTLL